MLYLRVGALLFCVFLIQCTILTSFAKESYRTNHLSEYEDYLTIVCTVDGGLHGIDKYGNKAWSSSTGNPMLSAQNYAAQDSDGDDDDGDIEPGREQLAGIIKRKGYSILPSTDGTLIYHSVTDGMRKTSVTARLLVEQTPFVSGEGISFTGRKGSRLLKLDANTGTILFDSAANNPSTSEPELLKTIDGAVNPVWVGRIDYSLEAVDTTTGRQEFNFTYSEFVPLPYGSQYEYGDAQGVRRQQSRGQNAEPSAEEEFEVATDVQLGEAEVVQLLGARAAAGWDSDDGDDAIPSIDESQGIVDASFDLGVEPSASSERTTAVRQTRVRKVKRKRGGRRRRKNRVGMEKRAATVSSAKGSMTALSEPLRKIELPDADALTLISTPDGELYFSDREGIVLEKVPIKLQSPVFSAFKLQRTYDATAQGENMKGSLPLAGSLSYESSSDRSGSDRWGVRSINDMHRVLTYTGADADTNVALSQNGLTVAGEVGQSSEQQVNRIIVQSPSAAEKELLYVLEVTELEMTGEDPALAKGLSIGNGADGTMDASAYPTKRELRAKARADLRQRQQQQPQRVQSPSSVPAPISAVSAIGLQTQTSEKDVSNKAWKRSAAGIGAGPGLGSVGRRILSPPQHRRPSKGLTGVGSLRLLDKVVEDSSGSSTGGALFGADSLTLSWEEGTASDGAESQSQQLVRKDIRVCLPRLPSFYFPVSWIPGVNVSLQNACPVHSLKQLRDSNEPAFARPAWGDDGVIIDLDDDEDDDDENSNDNGNAGFTFDAESDNELVRDMTAEKKKNSGMRGSHVLRPDLYEGSLFRSDPSQLNLDAQMHLFRGVLHHSHDSHPPQRQPTGSAPGGGSQGRQQQQSSWGSWQRGVASTDRSTGGTPSEPIESYLPVVAKAHPLSWMDVFALKVFAIVEYLLLYLVAVAIVTALIFVLGVYLVRSSPALAHLLPHDFSFSSQLHFALHALVGRVLLLFLPTAQGPVVITPLASQQKLVSRGSSSKIALMATEGDSQQAEGMNREKTRSSLQDVASSSTVVPITTAGIVLQEQLSPPPAALVVAASMSTVEEELVDGDGKRLLRVGNLVVHCEHVLGYGSHGTTVYRGSLDGRPLAVKRILTQFVRSADR